MWQAEPFRSEEVQHARLGQVLLEAGQDPDTRVRFQSLQELASLRRGNPIIDLSQDLSADARMARCLWRLETSSALW